MPSLPPVHGRTNNQRNRAGSAPLRPNGSRWRKRREGLLKRSPLCVYCRALGKISVSTHLDHIVALSLGGTSADDNLIGSCRDHNNEKAKLEQAWLEAGWPVSSLEHAAPIEGSLKWFIDVARNALASQAF